VSIAALRNGYRRKQGMADGNKIEAIMQALQRQQSDAAVRKPIAAESIVEEAQARLAPSSIDDAMIDNPVRRPTTTDSLMKAKYASTILRVARTSDRETAARLVSGIARDLPLQSELPEIVDVHLRAINSFAELAISLRDATNPKEQPPWKTALDAAAAWLRKVETIGSQL
jgi:hypothetical protein